MSRLSLIVALLTCFAAPAFAGLQSRTLTIDGAKREYLIYLPDAPAPRAGRRLIVVMHGGGGTAKQIHRSTKGLFDVLAATDGTIILYPQAVDKLWDLGEGDISDRLDNPRDDLKFLTTLVRKVSRDYRVDSRRVFATGISRGGQMSYDLACKAPGMFRAIAPVAMALPEFLRDDCRKMPPTGILVINGVLDPLVPWDGGPITLGRQKRDVVMSARETMEFFSGLNRCGRGKLTETIGAVDHFVWRRCRAPTELMRVNDGGHGWPGEGSVLPKRIVGPANRDIEATREIWEFFARY